MMIVAALAATGLLVTQYIAFKKAGQLADAQARLDGAKEAILTADSKEKDRQIAALRIQAGEAESGISAAKADASDALEKQQSVETKLAAQQERAAVAERSLLELQERIKPRRLTDQQAKDFVAALRRFPSATIRVGWTIGGGDEGFSFLRQLIPLFKEAGWTVANDEKGIAEHLEFQVIGIGILVRHPLVAPGSTEMLPLTPTLAAITGAFNAVGLDAQLLAWPDAQADIPEIVVG
jgi:hypothetical protein